MNRTQRALVKAAHKKLAMDREFKNDALYDVTNSCHFVTGKERLEREMNIFKASKKALRRLKK